MEIFFLLPGLPVGLPLSKESSGSSRWPYWSPALSDCTLSTVRCEIQLVVNAPGSFLTDDTAKRQHYGSGQPMAQIALQQIGELGHVLRERVLQHPLDVGSQRGWARVYRVPARQPFQPRLSPGGFFLLVHPPDQV